MTVLPPSHTISQSVTSQATTGTVITSVDIRSNFFLALGLSTFAGLSTGLGALGILLWPQVSSRRLGLWQALASGFMLACSLGDLIPTALADLSPFPALLAALSGALVLLTLQAILPDPDLSKISVLASRAGEEERTALWSGLLTAITLAIHNIPEGFAVAGASLRGVELGLPLAVAIAMHNIPEGAAIAWPVFFATKSKRIAFGLALLSGFAEPFGVLLLLAILSLFGSVSKSTLAGLLAAVAGVMICLSFAELIPQAKKNCGTRDTIVYTVVGFITMVVVLFTLEAAGIGV